jgi:hypothetical protein
MTPKSQKATQKTLKTHPESRPGKIDEQMPTWDLQNLKI